MESTVLVVCEEPLPRKAILKQLRQAGYEVDEASCFREAVPVLNARPVGAVVVRWGADDAALPDTCSALRKLAGFAHLAVVLISERRSSEDVLTAVEAGVDDFLAAPVEGPQLCERVESALALTTRRAAKQSRARIRHLYINK